jgi:hypothetical protein
MNGIRQVMLSSNISQRRKMRLTVRPKVTWRVTWDLNHGATNSTACVLLYHRLQSLYLKLCNHRLLLILSQLLNVSGAKNDPGHLKLFNLSPFPPCTCSHHQAFSLQTSGFGPFLFIQWRHLLWLDTWAPRKGPWVKDFRKWSLVRGS